MSLKNPMASNSNNGVFEDAEIVQETVKEVAQVETPAQQEPAPRAEPATQTFSVTTGSKFGSDPFSTKKDVFANMGIVVPYATFKQITIANGDMIVSGNAASKLGRSAKMKLLNWNRKWMVTAVNDPNKGGEAARKLIKWSLNGHTTDDGLDIATYVQSLQADGWEQAKCSERLEVTAQVISSETGTLVGEVVILSCAKSSVNTWNSFLVKSAISYMTKPASPDDDAVFNVKVTSITSKGNTWGAFEFDL